MKKYTTVMSAYGVPVGIDFKFHGMIANTLDAHRLIQHYQEQNGPEAADKIVNCMHITQNMTVITTFLTRLPVALYEQYFIQEAHPSAPGTLLQAALDGGVERAEADAFLGDEYEALPETKMLIREQAGNGIDSVPYVVFEGKRRDFTLEGAKEVEEYLKEMEKLVKETH